MLPRRHKEETDMKTKAEKRRLSEDGGATRPPKSRKKYQEVEEFQYTNPEYETIEKLAEAIDSLTHEVEEPKSNEVTPPSGHRANSHNERRLSSRNLQTFNLLDIPSASPSLLTEGEVTLCGDGGRDLERQFLRENAKIIEARTYLRNKSVVQQVRDDLEADEAKHESAASPSRFFIPCTLLKKILSQETIGLIIKELYPDPKTGISKEKLAPESSGPGTPSFRRTIAVLILIGKEHDLFWFAANEMHDSELPSDQQILKLKTSTWALDWGPQDYRNFCERRNEVSPAFFAMSGSLQKGRKKIVHYHFHQREILPFTKKHWTEQGGFGEVSKYDLHRDQQQLRRYTADGFERAVAVKRFTRADKSKEFKEEFSTLNRLYHLRTPHIAKLLCTYEIISGPESSDYFLMFECADMTLEKIFTEDPAGWRPDYVGSLASWCALQACHLTNALGTLHHKFKNLRAEDDTNPKTHVIHADLKPENILYFKNWEARRSSGSFGVLQITDFGLSSFHGSLSVDNAGYRYGRGAYRPPEAALQRSLSPSFDTWSLGCLFVELLIWLIQGPTGLKTFRKDRLGTSGFTSEHPCFWEVEGLGKDTKVSLSSVTNKWIQDLCEDPNSSQFVRDFCTLILENVLVVELEQLDPETKARKQAQSMGESNDSVSKRRITTTDLAKELARFNNEEESFFLPSRKAKTDMHKVQSQGSQVKVPKSVDQIIEEVKEHRHKQHNSKQE